MRGRQHVALTFVAVVIAATLIAGLATISAIANAAAGLSATAVSARTADSELAPDRTAVPGAFVWHDLLTHDVAASRAFYGSLFGWTFERATGIDPDYTIIRDKGQPIGGIVLLRHPDALPQWLAYLVVADVDATADAFRKAGGKIYRGPLNVHGDVRVAVVADSQGAPLGLASRGPRIETDAATRARPPAIHRWLWMEYVAREPNAALSFYSDVVGFKHELSVSRPDFTYHLLSTDRPRAGLFRSPWARDTSVWLSYVRVADATAMATRAVTLGGRIVLEPGPRIRAGSLAVIVDPAGAALALQRFPFDQGVTP